jgi:hypothetical protein
VLVFDVEVVPAKVAMWDSFEKDFWEQRDEWQRLADSHSHLLEFVEEDGRWFLDTHVLLFGQRSSSGRRPWWAEVPEEFCLRWFLDLEPRSPDDVGAFCASLGPVGRRAWYRENHPDPPEDWPSFTAKYLEGHRFPTRPVLDLDYQISSTLRQWWSNLYVDPECGSPDVKVQPVAPLMTRVWDVRWLGEVEIYQSLLRDMRNVWDFLCGGRSFDSLVADWTSDKWGWSLPEPKPHSRHHSEMDRARVALEKGLNPALSCYAVRVQVLDPESPAAGALPFEADHTVYSAMCLEFANQIAKDIPFRRCKNERCGRLFAVKTGSNRDWHRTRGVLHYCSDECANRQYQREHRRRKRDARRAENSGSAAVDPERTAKS